jgi:hypothetical protein
MSYKKIRTISLFLLLGIATLFFLKTTLQELNNQAEQYHFKNLKDVMNIREN